MALPMFLAMTAAEMLTSDTIPASFAWMACHFSPYNQGITNLPPHLPGGAILILDDRFPCQGHSASLAVQQLSEILEKERCESVLLDFQRPREPESEAMVHTLVDTLPCPVAVSESHAPGLSCPVFLSPAPLHVDLEAHLAPWQGREIWLEAALCQISVTITETGTTFAPQFPPEGLEGGFFDETLCCNYHTRISEKEIHFTLFDTPESLQKKLELARTLGVARAVGLYQELGKLA